VTETVSIERDGADAARAALEHCVGGGGVAIFPADTLYGLACDPLNAKAVARIHEIKGRDEGKPAAVMYFSLDLLPPAGPRTRAALEQLLPGPVLVVLPGGSGVRVPDIPALAHVSVPVLQTSANLSGGPDPRRLSDVPASIREGADLVLDGGELPGTPSTVLDLTDYERDGTWRVLREGAVSRQRLVEVLAR
jgi:L-threonylcarbamoyladenylate synthase